MRGEVFGFLVVFVPGIIIFAALVLAVLSSGSP
jgi:hypothetical protein